MANTNINHDPNAYRQRINESVGPLEYKLATPQQCRECFVNDPQYILQRSGASVSAKHSMIDVDSELMGITRKLTHDPLRKYLPKMDRKGNVSLNEAKFHPQACSQPTVESTLLSNPPQNLRGTGWNRWEWLFHNPQDQLERPFDWHSNTNLLARDTHRPCVPNPIDQTLVLPEPKPEEDKDLYEYNENVKLPIGDKIMKHKSGNISGY